MAKRRAINAFKQQMPSKEDLEIVSKQIIENTAKEESPTKEESLKKKEKPKSSTKRRIQKKPVVVEQEKKKMLYVDALSHMQAKINAAKRGMKLQEYITMLIKQDQSS